jgi:hypothetical protein
MAPWDRRDLPRLLDCSLLTGIGEPGTGIRAENYAWRLLDSRIPEPLEAFRPEMASKPYGAGFALVTPEPVSQNCFGLILNPNGQVER